MIAVTSLDGSPRTKGPCRHGRCYIPLTWLGAWHPAQELVSEGRMTACVPQLSSCLGVSVRRCRRSRAERGLKRCKASGRRALGPSLVQSSQGMLRRAGHLCLQEAAWLRS